MSESETNQEKSKDPFELCDSELQDLSQYLQYSSKKLDEKCKKSIFHLFFLKSIFNVKESKSRFVLLKKLQIQFDQGVYHVPLSDVDRIYECLFWKLPNYEPIKNDPESEDLLYLLMNIFMLRFYYYAFPHFYQIKTEDNIFTHDPSFIIKYFNKFSYQFKFRKPSDNNDPYMNLIKNDGSLTNIFNKLFEIYLARINFDDVANCIYQLMDIIDHKFLYHYLSQKNFFDKAQACFVNPVNNSVFRMNFIISFYKNFFTNNYKPLKYRIVFTNEEISEEEREEKKAISVNLIQDIKNLKVFDYLRSFLSSYIDQLIIKKRLIDIPNPLNSGQDPQIYSSFYPENPNDDDIMDIYTLFTLMFRTIYDPKYDQEYETCVEDFYEIIASVYMIIPDIFTSAACTWSTTLLDFTRYKNENTFGFFIEGFINSVRSRIYGKFLFDENIKKTRYFNARIDEDNPPDVLFRNLYKISASSLLGCLFPMRKDEFISPFNFLENLNFKEQQPVQDLLDILLKLSKTSSYPKHLFTTCFLYYNWIFEMPSIESFIKTYFNLFFSIRPNLNQRDYVEIEKLNIFHNFIKFFLTFPGVTNIIQSQQIFKFCESVEKYVTNPNFITEMGNIAISSNDLFKLKIITLLLKTKPDEVYTQFSDQVIKKVIDESIGVNPEETGSIELVQRIISISPFLVSIPFKDNMQIFDLLRNCIGYLNSLEQNSNKVEIIQLEEKKQSKDTFKDIYDQAKINLTYSLTNSFGFKSSADYISLISFLIQKYGMCFEVLNVISNIIGYLIDYIGSQGNLSNEIQATNDFIFQMMRIFIENHPKEIHPPNEEADPPQQPEKGEKSKGRRYKSVVFHFALFPVGYDNIIGSSRYKNKFLNKKGRKGEKRHNDIEQPNEDDNTNNNDEIDEDHQSEDDEEIERSNQMMQFWRNKERIPSEQRLHDERMQYEHLRHDERMQYEHLLHDERMQYEHLLHDERMQYDRAAYDEKCGCSSVDDIQYVNNCFLSYENEKKQCDDHFGFNIPHYSPSENLRQRAVRTVNFFTRNIAGYLITLILKFGIKPDTIAFFKQVIFNAYKNGLIRSIWLSNFFPFITNDQSFLSTDEDINEWIKASIARISILMSSADKSQSEQSNIYEIGTRSDQIKLIFHFLHKINVVSPGSINDNVIIFMADHTKCKKDDLYNFFRSDEADIDDNIQKILTSKS